MKFVNDESYKYLLDYFPDNKIFIRFKTLMSETIAVLKAFKIAADVEIDKTAFQYLLLDYFADIARIKEFQKIKYVNVQKLYAYTIYWFLRRHPIQTTKNLPNWYDVNEKVIIAIYIPKMLKEQGITYDVNTDLKNKESAKRFINLFFYNIKYRTYTPQSLELMIDAFFLGCTLK